MSTLKIPDLNLFRGKRNNRQKAYQTIQRQGLTLLQKTTNKQLLADIKAQLYLQNYQKTLNHFVSPSKYKQKAETYLKSGSKHQQLFLKSITLPKTMYRCPNCFSKEIQTKKKCFCQVQERILPLKRSKSNQPNLVQPPLTSRKAIIDQTHRITISNESTPPFNNQARKNIQNPKKIALQQQTNTDKPFSRQQEQQSSRKFEKNEEVQLKKLRILEIQKFRQDLHLRENKLQNIDMNFSESGSASINLNDLIEAKDTYIAKHKEILHSLDKIVEQSQNYRKY